MAKVLIGKKKYVVLDTSKDYHTQYGYFSKSDLAKQGKITTNLKKDFLVFDAAFIDLYSKISRGAQIIPLKDIGLIIAETGINKDSKVGDAGSGSGATACFLASIAKEVISYEIRDDHLKIAQKNKDMLGLPNLKLVYGDVTKPIKDKNFDVFILDVPAPWEALAPVTDSLKVGGFIVSYSPTIPQVADMVNHVKKVPSLVHVKTSEVVYREWEVDERKVRPKTTPIGHSGFLTFLRKVDSHDKERDKDTGS